MNGRRVNDEATMWVFVILIVAVALVDAAILDGMHRQGAELLRMVQP